MATGRFCAINANENFLTGVSTLAAGRASFALEEADLFIVRKFAAYDLSGMTSATAPPEIVGIARRIASCVYLRQELATASPEADEKLSFCKRLEAEANAMTFDALGRGYLVTSDGARLDPRESGASSSVEFPVLRR